jgi:hypothetical protein
MKNYFKFIFLAFFLAFFGLTNLTAQTINADGAKTKIRIGLVQVKTTGVGEGMDPQQFSTAIQNSLNQYLKSPDAEIVLLESKLASQIPNEAKEKQCDYLVFVTAAHKKGSGGFGKMFGKVAPVLGAVVPMAGVAGGIAGSVASTAIMTAGSMSSNVKAKDSLEFNLTVQKTGSDNPVLNKKYAAKAKSNGEDIFTPLIEQIAQDTLDTTNGKTVKTATDNK